MNYSNSPPLKGFDKVHPDPDVDPESLRKPFDFDKELKVNNQIKENMHSDDKLFEESTNYSSHVPNSNQLTRMNTASTMFRARTGVTSKPNTS